MLIWFVSLLVFLTVATGKETRYFLPAMPPLFVLLGGELAAFFDPSRRCSPSRDKVSFAAVCLLVPGGLAGLVAVLHIFWKENASQGMFAWAEVWQPYAVGAALFAVGAVLAAWLYLRRRENASFAVLVGTMWVVWAWVWPNFMPVVASQAPFKDFAEQLKTLSPAQRAVLKQVAQPPIPCLEGNTMALVLLPEDREQEAQMRRQVLFDVGGDDVAQRRAWLRGLDLGIEGG